MYISSRDADLTADTFVCFHHNQNWNRQWKKQESAWFLEDVCCCRQWSAEKRIWISDYLKQQMHNGGSVVAAFDGSQIIAFACIDGQVKGHPVHYSNLTMLFVDDRFHRSGIGKRLIEEIKKPLKLEPTDYLYLLFHLRIQWDFILLLDAKMQNILFLSSSILKKTDF